VGIPWRVAFALQADGWYLRSDIIWAKPNPMPESVTDRPTKSHEYLFLLTKRARYYYDATAIQEPAGPFHAGGSNNGLDAPKVPDPRKKQDALGKNTYTGFNDRWAKNPTSARNRRTVWTGDEPMWKLRGDLSDADRLYVLGELSRRGLSASIQGNTGGRP
jgi:hypothetical protein